MATLESLWNDYGWILPVALIGLCILACLFSRRGARRPPEREGSHA